MPLFNSSSIGTLAQWAAFIISTLAFFRPNLDRWYQRAFKKGHIDIHPLYQIEIGFSNLGPSIWLCGTLHSKNSDFFIKNIKAKVVKAKDKSQHEFSWSGFRSDILVSNNDTVTIRRVNCFSLKENNSFFYNIFFQDIQASQDIAKHILQCQRELISFMQASNIDRVEDLTPDNLTIFKQESSFYSLSEKLQRENYWDPGEYTLEISIETTENQNPFTFVWNFDISEDESQRIRLNHVPITDICLSGKTNFDFTVISTGYKQSN
jgi:hypothetical protein